MKMLMKAGRMLKCLGPTGKKLIRFSPNDKLMMVHEQGARRIYRYGEERWYCGTDSRVS